MRKTKLTILSILITIGIIAIIFWISFAVVAYRKEYLVFEPIKNKDKKQELYYKKDNIKYYSYGIDEIYIYERRFIFNTNKKTMKDIIDKDEFISMISNFNIYRYKYGNMIESKYTVGEGKVNITKCDYEDDNKDFYILSDEKYKNICRLFN